MSNKIDYVQIKRVLTTLSTSENWDNNANIMVFNINEQILWFLYQQLF